MGSQNGACRLRAARSWMAGIALPQNAKAPTAAMGGAPPPFAPRGRALAPAKALAMDETRASAGREQRGVPTMDIFVQYERSWSIQDALDQHAALAEQREVLTEIGRNRLRVRQTQLSFGELEVEESLEAARCISTLDAGDAQRVMRLAGRVRAAVRDLRTAARLKQQEQVIVNKHLTQADIEIERSRQEMTCMKEVIDDKSLMVATDDSQPAAALPLDAEGRPLQQRYRYCTNCKVGGHGQRFCEYLLERPDWRVYPNQKWFEDEKGNEYHCPLGKKLVDFADESHFSRIAMYLKGRAWLEEKTKVLELAPGKMPETYILENGAWRGSPPPDLEASDVPWFVKEADRNWGTSVHVVAKPSDCFSLVKPEGVYVVQPHIKDPLLTDDGRKCHIKFYVLLVGFEDGVRWHLYTFQDGYLSISPNKWSPTDLSKDTQVTIIRTERIGGWKAWADAYPKCKAVVAEVIERAVALGKLEGRLNKVQFEIFSADFIVDTRGDVWLFEFNMSPVLKDPKDAPKVNDADMVRGALSIVAPWSGGSPSLWDFAGEFKGQKPQPKAPTAKVAPPSPPASAAT
ncbi:unnamed protein product [Symbiodinium sp. CCMP2592]|nr:unnamed protein product [Symbiodinium sp. CCMP2592]